VLLSAQYFATTMMIVGMSVVVTVIVLQFHHHDPHGGKMPKWVRHHLGLINSLYPRFHSKMEFCVLIP
jgi:hypothetical protein